MTPKKISDKEYNPKKEYQSPELKEFGNIRELTAAGSRGRHEDRKPGKNRRP